MALKFKKPFGPGVSKSNKVKSRQLKIDRFLQKNSLRLRTVKRFGVPGTTAIAVPIKKGRQVSTPRKTSRGISF